IVRTLRQRLLEHRDAVALAGGEYLGQQVLGERPVGIRDQRRTGHRRADGLDAFGCPRAVELELEEWPAGVAPRIVRQLRGGTCTRRVGRDTRPRLRAT